MKGEAGSAQKYFDKVPQEWDALYSSENWFMYIVNRFIRQGLFDRYALTFKYCGEVADKEVLDIGCGTGRFSVEFARRGAARVTGLDFAGSMVDFSRKAAQAMGFAERCDFVCADFLAQNFNRKFDIVIAMGFFDYIKDAQVILRKIHSLTNGVFIASFPRPRLFWDIQRKIRYNLIKKCNIYSYTKKDLERLYKAAGFSDFKIIQMGGGYFVAAKIHS
ncbi:MAG: methyltransferase domain-containing protein [Bacteroidales bacterium]